MNPQILLDLEKLYPELILTVAFLCVVIADIAFKRIRKTATFLLAAMGLILAFVASIPLFREPMGSAFFGVLAVDPMAAFFKCFLILTSFFILLAAPGSKEFVNHSLGEFYALLLAVTLGMLLLASSMDMLMLYLSLEMVSIGSYIMVGYLKNDRSSNEASLKYLLFGAVATGSMLYGFTIVYGLTGTTKIAVIRDMLTASSAAGENTLLLFVATVLILAGFGFQNGGSALSFLVPGCL